MSLRRLLPEVDLAQVVDDARLEVVVVGGDGAAGVVGALEGAGVDGVELGGGEALAEDAGLVPAEGREGRVQRLAEGDVRSQVLLAVADEEELAHAVERGEGVLEVDEAGAGGLAHDAAPRAGRTTTARPGQVASPWSLRTLTSRWTRCSPSATVLSVMVPTTRRVSA